MRNKIKKNQTCCSLPTTALAIYLTKLQDCRKPFNASLPSSFSLQKKWGCKNLKKSVLNLFKIFLLVRPACTIYLMWIDLKHKRFDWNKYFKHCQSSRIPTLLTSAYWETHTLIKVVFTSKWQKESWSYTWMTLNSFCWISADGILFSFLKRVKIVHTCNI